MSQPRYPGGARLFHWLMAAIIVTVWFIGFGSSHWRGNAVRGGTPLLVHKAIASTVLFLVVARLVYRWLKRRAYPALPPSISPPMRALATGVHIVLYASVMMATPLSGWIWSSVAGHPVPVLGLFNLPPLAAVDHASYDRWMWIHRAFAWSAGAVIVVHVLAALKHHFIDRDEILVRMLPGRRRASPPAFGTAVRDGD